jgi:hypothetical protein
VRPFSAESKILQGSEEVIPARACGFPSTARAPKFLRPVPAQSFPAKSSSPKHHSSGASTQDSDLWGARLRQTNRRISLILIDSGGSDASKLLDIRFWRHFLSERQGIRREFVVAGRA